MDRRTGNDSRCCTPAVPPLEWVNFTDESHPAVVELTDWLNTLNIFTREHELGQIDALFDSAAQGLLFDGGDETTKIKPIRKDPDLYELRRTALSKRLRFYHGEPRAEPQRLYQLHRHIKHNNAYQDSQIDHAQKIYRQIPSVPED